MELVRLLYSRKLQWYTVYNIDHFCQATAFFPLSLQITIPCTVNSYVRPNVQWTKNGYRLQGDNRIQVNEVLTADRVTRCLN